MSDVTPDNSQYKSEIDDAFASAWNQVHSQADPAAVGEDPSPTGPAGGGDPAPAASGEGADSEAANAGAPADGARPGDLPGLPGLSTTEGQPATPGGEAPPEPTPAGVPSGDTGLEPTDVVPLFATANQQIDERMEAAFKRQAFQEVSESIDAPFIDALRLQPLQMVGMEVPSVRPGAEKGEMMKLLDSATAREWQETVTKMIEREIEDLVEQKREAVKPMTSALQESVQMLENNPDLIPGTKGYDAELNDLVTKAGKEYELVINGRVAGYHVKMQPLINTLRDQLNKSRGSQTEQQKQEAARAAQAARAAEQARTPGGQFDSPDRPQAGIPSKAPVSGEAEDDYTDFWRASGVIQGGNLHL